MITDNIARNGFTEDGDVEFTHSVVCDTVAEAKEMTPILVARYGKADWAGKGGKLAFSKSYVVDGAEVAIEAQNDAWARREAERYPSEYF